MSLWKQQIHTTVIHAEHEATGFLPKFAHAMSSHSYDVGNSC